MIISISGKKNSGKDLVGKIIQYLTSPADIEEGWKFVITDEYEVGTSWEIKKFADKLKDMVCLLLDCSREDLEDEEFKNKELGEEWWKWEIYPHDEAKFPMYEDYKNQPPKDYIRSVEEEMGGTIRLIKMTPRLILQLVGTECGREIIHPNIWVNALFADYKSHIKNYPNLIKSNGNNLIEGETYSMGKAVYPNWIITDVRFPNEYQAIQKQDHLHIHLERFQVGDKVNWNDPELDTLAEWEIFECYDDSCLIGLSGLGHREIESEAEVPYSELSIITSDKHKSENTDLLKKHFNKDVVYLYNVGNIKDLVEKLNNILIEKINL